jgi:serine/threonine-protein kinase
MLRIPLNSQTTEAKRAAGAFQYFLDGEGNLHRFDGPRSITEAIRSFEHAIQLDPTFSEAIAGLAEAYFARFKDAKELRWLGKADEMVGKAAALPNPGAQVHLTLGIIERETGHADEAIEQFGLALAVEPKNIEALRNLATAFEAKGDKKKAQAAFQQAVRARPAYWPVHSSLAAFYAGNGQYAEAEAEFNVVTQLAPQNPLGYRNLGGLLNLMRRHEEAITALRRSIQIRPTAAAYSNLGAVLFATEQFVEASNAMLQAVSLSDKDAMLHFNAADVLWLLPEKRAQATMEYRRAADLAQESLGVNPTDPRTASALAVCLARLGDTAGALESVHHSLQLAPGNPSVRFKVARVMAITGHKAEANQNLTSALTLGYPPDESRIYPELSG